MYIWEREREGEREREREKLRIAKRDPSDTWPPGGVSYRCNKNFKGLLYPVVRMKNNLVI